MEWIAGMLTGALVLACGILMGRKLPDKKQDREQDREETEAERIQREKDENLREQWETMLRYDGRSA